MNNGEPIKDSCCCGCSLRCGIIFFGVMSIIQLIYVLIMLLGMVALISAATSIDTQSSNDLDKEIKQASQGAIVTAVVIALLVVVVFSAPGIIYIRFFCQETQSRLNMLPCAQVFNLCFAIVFFIKNLVWAISASKTNMIPMAALIIGMLFPLSMVALQYYFYVVVKRYVAMKSSG